MATKTKYDRSGCTIQWKIENLSHCGLSFYERIESPSFIADAVGGTKWTLWCYPEGDDVEYQDEVKFYLHREKDCSGPDEVIVSFQLAFLGRDGSILDDIEYLKQFFYKDREGAEMYAPQNRIFITEREAYLPEDTLTLQCTIWNTDKKPVPVQKIFARTVFEVHRRSLELRIEKFSTRKSGFANKFKDGMVDFDLVFTDGVDEEKKLAIDIKSFDESVKYVSFNTYIVDNEGAKENLGTHKYSTYYLKRNLPCRCEWFFTKKCMENEIRFLQNDVLSLNCEYVCSNGAILNQYCDCVVISPNWTKDVAKNTNKTCIRKEESLDSVVLLKDLKSMYSDGICSDIQLRTSTQTLPAHKCILSTRSPVFRKMFSNDIKGKNCWNVDITDFEADTVHRMLQYLYTDTLEDLHFEGALKLYAIADKYEIVSLKSRCSSFLKENLCPSNVCKALVLSDLHHDGDLMNSVQDYILRQGKVVFDTQEWQDLMNTHLKLAADIMFKKVKA